MILKASSPVLKAALAATLLLAVPVCVRAEDKVLAKVDGQTITEADVRVAEEDLAGSLPKLEGPALQRYVVDYLVDLKLLALEGQKQKLAEGDEFQHRLAYAKDRIVMEKLLSGIGNKAVTDETMKAFYDEQVKALPKETEVHARHILVDDEATAKKALARVKGGEDFAKVAAELSKDPGSGKEGGDLGWFTKDRMVPEFAEAAFKTEPGQISDIVKSQFGYHIIKVEERREKKPPAFELVKAEIQRYMTQRAQEAEVTKLRAEAKIERFDQPAKADQPGKTDAQKPADGKNP